MVNRPSEYKDLTYPQLRSFCETARLEGMAAAAKSLGLAQPTVWKQIHSLEMLMGTKLVEPHQRGCRLTPEGEVLLRLASPLVVEFESLRERFEDALERRKRRLVVCATPRPFDEELLPCVSEFERQYPEVQLSLRQVATREQVLQAVEVGGADLGVCSLRPLCATAALVSESVYDLELVLLVPRGHALAKRKGLRLEDLASYSFLNHPNLYADWGVAAALEAAQIFNSEVASRRIELALAGTIRRYVAMGLGIGIVVRPVDRIPTGELVERPLSQLLGIRMAMYAYYRKSVAPADLIQAFIGVIRQETQATR